MAALVGTKVASSLLGRSDAEKAFRPWWDNFEDQLIYGLICLGLIVFPTAMINGTPLLCTYCKEGLCGDKDGKAEDDPGHHAWWVKQYCTFDPETVDQFLLYFPYLLLIVAIVLYLIERAFNSAFKANKELEAFHSLLVKEEILKGKPKDDEEDEKEKESKEEEVMDADKLAYTVSQGLGSSKNYYRSYLIRTITELLISLALFIWLIVGGTHPIFGTSERAPGSAILGTKSVLCEVSKEPKPIWYHCAGLPFQFYMIIFIAALVLLFFYIASCLFVLAWLALPSLGSLSSTMAKFEKNFKQLTEDPDENQFKGGLYSIYYNNKDTKLLLDLLAATSGIGPCLKLLCLFEKSLQQKAQVENINVILQEPDSDGCRNVVVEFNDSKAVVDIFSQIPNASCTYAVEITPLVKSGSWHVLTFVKESSLVMSVELDEAEGNGKEHMMLENKDESIPIVLMDKTTFKKLLPGTNYKISILTQVNGTVIAKTNSSNIKFE